MKVIIKTLANVLLIFLINISYAKSENIIKLGLLVPITGEHSYKGKSVMQSVILRSFAPFPSSHWYKFMLP